MIFCIFHSNYLQAQKLNNGWYILVENCSGTSCIDLQVWNSTEMKKCNTNPFLDFTHIQEAIPTFDESHQPMIAIQIDENYSSTFSSFIQKNNSQQLPIAIVLDNQIIIHGTPVLNDAKTKLEFKGKYTFQETKTIAQKINNNLHHFPKSKKHIRDENYLKESLNLLLFQTSKLQENPTYKDILEDNFLLRIQDSKSFNKNEFLHLNKFPLNNTESIEKSFYKIDTTYFYWSKDFKTCEIKTYIIDKNKNIHILFSIWLKEKNKWKLWRIYLDN